MTHSKCIHRFVGWTATALVWAQVVLLTRGQNYLENALVHSASFYLMTVLSCSLMLHWINLQKIPVRSVFLSHHAVQMFVDYVIENPSPLLFVGVPGSFQRFSTGPLYEWHSFAAIATPGRTGFSIIISRASDWSTEMK